ncbi:uncharacterized protein EAF01_011237 [Botrytis porri]|uniref:Uncharacterized protein n=1 Tax=Botrytis porri TaxID=87229 RepID=A0A4Z1KQR8_9HELO|nr:uncharacterized protein EAF01_011237 [Botrytis porri]KAF7886559.1 hypothetical protein EAF01_011237 [Botrytis porri]TGO83895.1 hypothetical protein BPOR_0578g00040 [Botrytis porri]
MGPTIIQTSKVVVLDLGEDAKKPVFTEDDELVEICAPFAFKFVHSAERVRDPVTKKVTMCTEAEDYVWFYERLYKKRVQKRGEKPYDIIVKDLENIRYYPDMAHRPTSVRFNEIKIKETLGVLYSADYKVSAKSKLFEVCTNIRIERKNYKGYEDWIEKFAEQGLDDNIFSLAHNTRGLKVDYKLPSSTDMITDPTKGWLYDSKRKDHILCRPTSGKPVLNEDDEFIWLCDLNKRKPKPTRTVSAPVNGSTSPPKVLQKKSESKDFDNRQTEGKHREIKPHSQGSSKDKLSSQISSEERILSQRDSKVRPLGQGGSRDKLPSQSDSNNIPPKRSDYCDKISCKSDLKVVPSKQSDCRDKISKQSDVRKSPEKKYPARKTTSGSEFTTKRPVAGRSQTFA